MAQPNIFFILSDQHAQHALGCYGDEAGVTPNLDKLAQDGVVFENTYCASPICGPSRMSLMTGRQPHENGCWLNGDILNSGTPTFAHALGAAGYRTALIGRMHFIGPDQTHGFSQRLVGDHSANWPGNPSFDHGELSGTSGPNPVSIEKSGPGTNAYDLKDRDATAAAIDWLHEEGQKQKTGTTGPFHMTLGLMLPHPPYVADPEDFDAVAGNVPEHLIAAPAENKEHPWYSKWRHDRGIGNMDTAQINRSRQAYWAMVRRLDQHIGQVLEALDAAGLRNDTLVIYTSDHGDHLGNRGLFWKHTFYDESAKVPLIMRWPNRIPASARRTKVIGLTDLGATMLDAANGTWTGGGNSLLPVAADASAPWVDEVVSEYCTGTADSYAFSEPTMNRMVRKGRFKLCYYHGYPPQLFDMEADPNELTDLADNPNYDSICKALLLRILSDWNPNEIERAIHARESDAALLAEWARQTSPKETHRWHMPEGKHSSLDGS